MANSDTNPQIREKYSPLNTLSMQALRRYGDFHPGTVDGDVMLMFIEFANLIIDEIRMHPYHDNTDIDYYQSITDVREIQDPIIVAGLLFHYATQQVSDKIEIYMGNYYRTLNQRLWERHNGNTVINLYTVDGGTNKRNIAGGKLDTNNGVVTY